MLHLSHQQMQELLTSRPLASTEELGYDLYHTTFESIIDDSICKGKTKSIQIREGITFLQVDLTFQQDTEVEMLSVQPQVGFGFCLKGHSIAHLHEVGNEKSQFALQYADRTAFVYANTSSSGYQQFWKDRTLQAFYIHFSYESFSELIGDSMQELPRELSEAVTSREGAYLWLSPMPHELHALCLNLLQHSTFRGKSREFYVEAKVIELIAYQLDSLLKPDRVVSSIQPPLTRQEEKKIDDCYQQILKGLSTPPSLIALAKNCGLSVYRMKNGFRARYGDTPFRILTELRMLKAKNLLEHGEHSVSEIAFEVGYSSLGTFSNTFFERFGVRPSAYKKG